MRIIIGGEGSEFSETETILGRICGRGHELIVYHTDGCPLCEALDQLENLKIKVDNLETYISELE